MSLETVINDIATHLATQKKRSADGHGCCYRDGDGNMCAIGALIPNELYNTDIERMSVSGLTHNANPYGSITEHLLSLAPEVPTEKLRTVFKGIQEFHDLHWAHSTYTVANGVTVTYHELLTHQPELAADFDAFKAKIVECLTEIADKRLNSI